MAFLRWLQETELSYWIGASPSIFAYPTILMLHTVGLGVVVGINVVIAGRILGLAQRMPMAALEPLYKPMWWFFGLNAVTGALLFVAGAEFTGVKLLFYIKLLLIALALLLSVRIRHVLAGSDERGLPSQARFLAVLSLTLWTAAIFAGRYTAYVGG